MGRGNEAVSRPQGRNLPSLPSEFREAFRSGCGRLRGAQARHSPHTQPYPRAHSVDEAGELQDHPCRAIFRPENSPVHRPRNRRSSRGVLALGGRRERGHDLFSAIRLRYCFADQGLSVDAIRRPMEILPFLLAPFLASLILTGIHAYLGVHVVERGVIFVDLALAQIAALGATFAILMGMDPHGSGAYWLSLAFTFAGAAIFAFARTRRGHIPQEAFIGIAYAVASATAILAMSKATGETEHLKDMLVGNILAVSKAEVLKTAVLYGIIGIFHYFFRKKFLLISTDPAKAEASGLNIRFWDFLFYASFGFVVTSSVAIAGVLLVFCYLIVPSVGAMLFADKIGRRLAIGWTMGTLVSGLGVYFSVLLDLPTGATIVCTFGGVLILMFFVHLMFFHGDRARRLEGAGSVEDH